MSTWLLTGFARLVALLSWRGAQVLGAWLGLVWFQLVRIRRRVVRENLELALPNRRQEHAGIARETYRHLGTSALELLKLCSMDPREIVERVRCHGLEHFDTELARGRGVIVVTAHYGNFDLLACSQALRGAPLAIVSRDLHGAGTNRFWMRTRERCGLEIIPDSNSARQVLRWLRDGKALGLVVDQRTSPERGGVQVPFCGQPVWTTTAPARLALRTGASLVPVRIERHADGAHDLFVEPPLQIDPAVAADPALALTLTINQVVERWVVQRPAHWMWLHRRFAGVRPPNRALSRGVPGAKLRGT